MINKNQFKNKKIVVLGDIILDHFIYGISNRMSPEAPVPIVEVESEKYRMGGAANVAHNIKKLGAECTLFGAIGDDNSGKKVVNLARKNNIKTELYVLKEHKTTTKSRVFISHHQISRLDYEVRKELIVNDNKQFLKKVDHHIKESDAIVISDYCKGFISNTFAKKIIEFATSYNKKIIVDTKKTDLTCFENADYITPNVKELGDISQKEIKNEKKDIEKNAIDILKKYNFKNIVVTRSDKGACIVNLNNSIFVANKKIKVFDVTGAGDSFVSIFSLMKSLGVSDKEILKISTLVGSIAVSKPGTYAVSIDEIIDFIKNEK